MRPAGTGKMKKGCILILLILSTLSGCQGTGGLVPVYETGERKSARSTQSVHRVNAGETLYSIAWRYGYDYRELAKWNNIKPPYTIFIDQKLRLKKSKFTAKTSGKPAATKTKSRPAKPKIAKKTQPRKSTGASVVKWYWPLEGELVSKFSLKGDVNKGLDIAGRNGQSVASAAAGTVVYAGGGLRGYGKLVIVKHSDHYLSAYGNNSAILVKEGDEVRHGKIIAKLGSNGIEKGVLHFEIRRDGKPEDPLKYLPKKK